MAEKMSDMQAQPVDKKWCAHHKYNVSHVTKYCHFLNKLKKRNETIKKVVVDESVKAVKVKKFKKWCSYHEYNWSHTSDKCFKLPVKGETLEKLDEIFIKDENDETQEPIQIFESFLSMSRLLWSLLFVCVLYLYFLILFHVAN